MTVYFARYDGNYGNGNGRFVGPFMHRHTVIAWLEQRGYKRKEEGYTWELYEAEDPHDEWLARRAST